MITEFPKRISFIELSSTREHNLTKLMTAFGFTHWGDHKNFDCEMWVQGLTYVLVNYKNPQWTDKHKHGVSGYGYLYDDAEQAHAQLIGSGLAVDEINHWEYYNDLLNIKELDENRVYVVDIETLSTFLTYFDQTHNSVDNSVGLIAPDHITQAVHKGTMEDYYAWYQKHFGFEQVNYFDIKGKATGLKSIAMKNPNREFAIPIVEDNSNGQVDNFLKKYNGQGVQHLAFTTNDIFDTMRKLSMNGVEFLAPPPDKYYVQLNARIKDHGLDIKLLKSYGILVDGQKKEDMLLQIFTKPVLGPTFFEVIQRAGNQGFGEGNFQALFDAIEGDEAE